MIQKADHRDLHSTNPYAPQRTIIDYFQTLWFSRKTRWRVRHKPPPHVIPFGRNEDNESCKRQSGKIDLRSCYWKRHTQTYRFRKSTRGGQPMDFDGSRRV